MNDPILAARNCEEFGRLYEAQLRALVLAEPVEYAYSVDDVPRIAAKMCASYAVGGANLGTAAKRTAKQLGIKPTLAAIRAYLNP